jgi:hypothetical protein
MTPALRKLALTAHVMSSVGWLGAVAVFVAFAVVALTSGNAQIARAGDLAMDVAAWFVVVPFCFASCLTGLISSLGTQWGLFRHYWVLIKFFITLVATAILLLHMEPIHCLGEAAKNSLALSAADLLGMRTLLVTASGAALVVLLVLTALSIYKPRGMTRYGWRKQQARTESLDS